MQDRMAMTRKFSFSLDAELCRASSQRPDAAHRCWLDSLNEATRRQHLHYKSLQGSWNLSDYAQRKLSWLRESCLEASLRSDGTIGFAERTGCQSGGEFHNGDLSLDTQDRKGVAGSGPGRTRDPAQVGAFLDTSNEVGDFAGVLHVHLRHRADAVIEDGVIGSFQFGHAAGLPWIKFAIRPNRPRVSGSDSSTAVSAWHHPSACTRQRCHRSYNKVNLQLTCSRPTSAPTSTARGCCDPTDTSAIGADHAQHPCFALRSPIVFASNCQT